MDKKIHGNRRYIELRVSYLLQHIVNILRIVHQHLQLKTKHRLELHEDLRHIRNVLTDPRTMIDVREQHKPIELPARADARILDISPRRHVRLLPRAQHARTVRRQLVGLGGGTREYVLQADQLLDLLGEHVRYFAQ